jgi:hypothetical protein
MSSESREFGDCCDLCGTPLAPHLHYIVRIDVLADPSVPAISSGQLGATNFGQAISSLINEMKGMDADQLQDQVFRRFEYRVCPKCQMRVLANPLGKPRESRLGKN